MEKPVQDAFNYAFKRLDETIEQLRSLQSFNDPSVEGFYDSVEYKIEKVPRNLPTGEVFKLPAIQDWFDDFGADGWDLKGFEWGCAVFTRRVRVAIVSEDEGETEEPES